MQTSLFQTFSFHKDLTLTSTSDKCEMSRTCVSPDRQESVSHSVYYWWEDHNHRHMTTPRRPSVIQPKHTTVQMQCISQPVSRFAHSYIPVAPGHINIHTLRLWLPPYHSLAADCVSLVGYLSLCSPLCTAHRVLYITGKCTLQMLSLVYKADKQNKRG